MKLNPICLKIAAKLEKRFRNFSKFWYFWVDHFLFLFKNRNHVMDYSPVSLFYQHFAHLSLFTFPLSDWLDSLFWKIFRKNTEWVNRRLKEVSKLTNLFKGTKPTNYFVMKSLLASTSLLFINKNILNENFLTLINLMMRTLEMVHLKRLLLTVMFEL